MVIDLKKGELKRGSKIGEKGKLITDATDITVAHMHD